MYKSLSYYHGEYPFANQDIDPAQKGKDYCQQNTEAIYSLYLKGETSWGYDSIDYFNNMRRYADGKQSYLQYQSFIQNQELSDDTTPTIFDENSSFNRISKRSGYAGLMSQNLSPAAKILSSLHGLMDKLDYDVMCDTIDADSRGLVEFMKYEQFHKARDIKFQNEFKTKAGLPIDEPTNFPKTKEELDAFEAREGFKLNVAKSMQKLLRYTFYNSKWDGVVRKKMNDDLITLGYATSMDYFDEETQTFKAQWLDPAKAVVQYSNEFDYEDSEYCGYFDTMTVSNLRLKLPELSHEEIVSLARGYTGKFGNPKRFLDKHSLLDKTTNTYGCDGFKIAVFKAFWIDNDSYKKLYWKGKNSARLLDLGYGSKVKELTDSQKARGFKQEVRVSNVRQVYQCSWVVDSNICFDYGKYSMGARPEMTKPRLPIHAEQLLQSPIIYRLVPIFDQIAITWLQFLNDLANMVQRGYAVNMAMLMNVTMNGKDLDPANVLSLWKQKGLLPYMLSPTGQYGGGMALPITPIEGGLGKRVEETSMALQMYYKSIEDIVGINPLSLGATPDPNAPVSTSEAALRATSNVLKPILDAMFEIKESLATSLCDRIQIGLRVSDRIRKAYAGIVNPMDIKTMLLAEQNGTKYGIMLRARPDDKQRGAIMRYMEIALQAGSLSPEDAMYYSERIESGADISEIRQEIAYSIQKNKEAEQQAQQANIQAQNDGLAQIEQMKAQNTAQQTVLDTQGKIAEEDARARSKARLQRMEQNYKLLEDTQKRADAEAGIVINTSNR